MKKKKLPAPHEVVKSYVKVAQDRLKEVFFTRPEWRKPASAAAVDVVISRIDEVYYPYSSKDKHMVAVWRQVLKEKREEMLEELNIAKNSNIPHEKANNTEERRRGAESAPSACPLPLGEWSKPQISRLRADIKKNRCGSKIARELKITPSHLTYILKSGRDRLQPWLPKIAKAFDALVITAPVAPLRPVPAIDLLDQLAGSLHVAIEDDHAVISGGDRAELAKNIDSGTPPRIREDARGPFDFPQRATYLGGSLTTDIKDGQLTITVRVDIANAIRMAARQLAIEMNKTPHDHPLFLQETPKP